jgi:hypothetical protein
MTSTKEHRLLSSNCIILWSAAWKPERRSGLAKHLSPATFGPAGKNRIAPVSIQQKPLYNNRGNAIAIQRLVGSLIEPWYNLFSIRSARRRLVPESQMTGERDPVPGGITGPPCSCGDINTGTWSQIWDSKIYCILYIVKVRPVLSSKRALHIKKPQWSDSNKNLYVSPRWVLYSKTDLPTDRRS